jgi:hypothetical protein
MTKSLIFVFISNHNEKMKTKILFLWVFLLPATAGFAESGTTGPLTWSLDDGRLTISGTGAMPDYFSAGNAPWYSYRSSVRAVVIGEGVTSIGSCAFSQCSSLATVTIGGSVASIGASAFELCSALTSIAVPESVENIGFGAFLECANLVSVDVAAGNSTYSSLDGVLYNKSQTILLCYPAGKRTELFTVPGTVRIIDDDAFYGCGLLSTVVIPEGVESIGEKAFAHSALKSVSIARSVGLIGYFAFVDCLSLTDITVFWHTPSEVSLSPTYGGDVFEGVDKSAVFLHVPPGTEAAYLADEAWKDFRLGNSYLAALTVDAGILSPHFSPYHFSYRVYVASTVEEILLSATPMVEGSSVSGDGRKALEIGTNSFEITVTAPEEDTGNAYRIDVYRLPGGYSLEIDEDVSKRYTPVDFVLAHGTFRLDMISGYTVYYALLTGDFSGAIPLRFDLSTGESCTRTISVEPHSVYRVTLDIPVNHYAGSYSITTPYDDYGRPGTPYLTYNDYLLTIAASVEGNGIHSSEIAFTGRASNNVRVSDVVLVGSGTGMVPAGKGSLYVYPNPVAESFRIGGSDGSDVALQVCILDASGRTVLRQVVGGGESVAIGHLPQGIYLVRVNGETFKVVKD